jgi:DNA-binding NarL/FixJ family response regulator
VVRAARHGEVLPTLYLSAPRPDGTELPVGVSTIVLVLGSKSGMIVHLCRVAEPEPPGAAMTATLELTNREREVLRALCRGHSTEAMAEEMGVSATTIRNHVQHLLAKLATHSRAEAIAIAFRDGLNT